MYPSLPYFDRGRIYTPRNSGVGYIFLLLHNLYLKKENKVLEEDAYNTKIISLKNLPVSEVSFSVYPLCFKVGYTRVHLFTEDT